jgi:hypothetical protein
MKKRYIVMLYQLLVNLAGFRHMTHGGELLIGGFDFGRFDWPGEFKVTLFRFVLNECI